MSHPERSFDPKPAAELLADLATSGRRIAELPPEMRPRTIDEGYDIQDALIPLLAEPAIGWKLGVGSARLKRESGVGRSIAGRVLDRHRYDPGATVPLPNAAPVTVEFEIAFVLACDIAPDDEGLPLHRYVAETRAVFELVLSRFVDRRTVGWPSFAADNAGFQALIVGPRIDPDGLPELLRSLVVTVDGRERARVATGEDATDPDAAFADLVAIARERGVVLPKGSIVSTGSASMPFAVDEASADIAADFLGRSLRFRIERSR